MWLAKVPPNLKTRVKRNRATKSSSRAGQRPGRTGLLASNRSALRSGLGWATKCSAYRKQGPAVFRSRGLWTHSHRLYPPDAILQHVQDADFAQHHSAPRVLSQRRIPRAAGGARFLQFSRRLIPRKSTRVRLMGRSRNSMAFRCSIKPMSM
jgi:hypothetical protein